VLLVRHGVTASTASSCRDEHPAYISRSAASPRPNASPTIGRTTAQPVALYVSHWSARAKRPRDRASAPAPCDAERGLLECDFGLWTGKKLNCGEEARVARRAARPEHVSFSEGESFTEMQLRMWTTLERIAAKHRNRTIIVVSHADPIKAPSRTPGVPLTLPANGDLHVLDQRHRIHERDARV